MMNDAYTTINREIIIDAPIESVFSAVSDQDQLTHWFPDLAILEKKKGGLVSLGS